MNMTYIHVKDGLELGKNEVRDTSENSTAVILSRPDETRSKRVSNRSKQSLRDKT